LENCLFQETSNDKVAVDLGSGVGKPSLTFALVLDKWLAESIGVELLEGLHKKSLEMKQVCEG
jgi:16S rRNA G527 N7-methylase RsmG